ncbi:phage tail tube protein [Paracoccus sp. Z330]|uniref:Phage tail tube protein n=1 Tax=Paracoccus onchidii TaxID=3017813 RepID=A0ABT4ZF43_9RHOB|nr:phage tail tube protein [Paracoccus onchidii]MDB6177936.1 phage tail tube protein [Paracoccus onchidii]
MPDGQIGYGSQVRIGVGATPNWTELEFVGDIEMPDEQIDEIEVTHMQSPGRRKQFISGLTDGGEVSIPMNYIPGSASDVLLLGLKASGETVQVEITLTAAGTPETYAGFLKGYARTAPVNDKMMATATFRLSEAIEP